MSVCMAACLAKLATKGSWDNLQPPVTPFRDKALSIFCIFVKFGSGEFGVVAFISAAQILTVTFINVSMWED